MANLGRKLLNAKRPTWRRLRDFYISLACDRASTRQQIEDGCASHLAFLASRLRSFGIVEQTQKLAGALLLIPSLNKFVIADIAFAFFQLRKAGNLACIEAIEHCDVLNLVVARAEPDVFHLEVNDKK